jgi:ACS family glucarate transporter-like MFS transporter
MGGGILGSIVAWNYWALLVCRLLTGIGAAMIPPNSMAIIADHFPPAERGRPISILISASFLGPVLAIPVVALLADLGGWRSPFAVVGGLCLILWGFQWLWLPQQRDSAAKPSRSWQDSPR